MGCENLNDVYCYAVEPPAIEYFTFDEHQRLATLHVPEKSIEAYKLSLWNDAFNGSIVPLTEEDKTVEVKEVESARDKKIVSRYDLQGRQTTKPQGGLNIIRMNDGSVLKVLEK